MNAAEARKVVAEIRATQRQRVVAKLIAVGCTDRQPQWLADCGILWGWDDPK